ncbi:MAG: bifunctional 5,10-methylenetetrahydrofolate dehydrogenase/5,10-methenyltetrahydrofolate cyclohydrolase [Oligoflexales bacterium]
MTANLIDGKKVAEAVKTELKGIIDNIVDDGREPPCLAVILVGDDEASKVYVGHKEKACALVGVKSLTYRLPNDTSQDALEALIAELSDDPSVNGILLQLPLPRHLNKERAIDLISPRKDVDGLHPYNQGMLAGGRVGLFPCTPLGIMRLITSTGMNLNGKVAVVVGRSMLVGAPVSHMLNHAGASVINLHSRSVNPWELARLGDILVVATGVRHLVDKRWIKPGAVVIDVGIHRHHGKLVGDVNFDDARDAAGHITPVPGGVGPMTIAMLLSNCVKAWQLARQ